ncbi:chorismate mutase [Anaerobacillus sp. MEB173]|uniref:chorismate mutase n=1 Tax=Anaerobacillus sp. MEB173 TaxID=3383345 RepID=UPI003F91466A
MIRGIRGAITVPKNEENVILEATKRLFDEIIKENHVKAEAVAQVLITVTHDLDATFPAKAMRGLEGWQYVPVMCAQEIPVPNSLPNCIRVMLTVNSEQAQSEIKHVYLEDATKLRPDLQLTKDR